MRGIFKPSLALLCSASLMSIAAPAMAQQDDAQQEEPADQSDAFADTVIVVTAQRQSQALQDVPVAVSAFSAENIEAQQIENSSDLQLTLPNVTFTKTNFTSSSFTIRGIGDLCVGVTCDQATAIHQNERPLFASRIFETEFFDIERIEVLRGPQGTLFGRSATSGAVNIVTAKPDLSGMHASIEGEYGNYDSYKVKGMINVPLMDTLGIRVAGYYLNRDGYTRNLFDGSDLDGRDQWAVRGSLRWEPTPDTTLDLLGYYTRESDNRLRIQKMLCQRDPTGVLGCLNNRLDTDSLNGNSTFPGVLTSAEFLRLNGFAGPTVGLALGSIYGPDIYANAANPDSFRQVVSDSPSNYFSSELIIEGTLQHHFGPITAKLSGLYMESKVDSGQDYNLLVQDRGVMAGGLNTLAAFSASPYFAPVANALIPGGPNGQMCTSSADDLTYTGVYGGHAVCGNTPLDFDRSVQDSDNWSVEGVVSSDFDGMFNFLIGGIYFEGVTSENSYYVNAFGIDYASGILGAAAGANSGGALPPSFVSTPYFRNNTDYYKLKSWGIFGEAYVDFTDNLKLTLGVRYNDDEKFVRASSHLLNFFTPHGTDNAFNSPLVNGFPPFDCDAVSFSCGYDGDPGVAGNQRFQERNVSFDEITGRAVLDYKITPDNLIYASWSRGYKSGGVNPPLDPSLLVAESFGPEIIYAYEIGSKNTFGNMQLNLTGFYYDYSNLQLSRIVGRTAVNDNVDAEIWGLEIEALIRPVPEMLINMGLSWLDTKVSSDKFLVNPRDPGGGRDDAVIIKDITNGGNCAVVPTTPGNAAGANGYVNAINNNINTATGAGLQPTTTFPSDGGIASTGAFSVCKTLAENAAAFGPLFGGIEVLSPGVPVNIRGNNLPQAPDYKFNIGAQYEFYLGGDMDIVPRIDVIVTGDSFGQIFNGRVNRIDSYTQANAQIQLNGPDRKWFVRGFIQNIFDTSPVTGLFVSDASTGLFTNAFTLDPRRYGIAAGAKF